MTGQTLMSLEEQLAESAQLTEAVLQSILDEAEAQVPARLLGAMRHALLGGGKRFRPFLVMQSARLFQVTPDISVFTGAALECVHCYSLVHDDLPAMDDDELRRGRPTVHIAYDEATAILAGDALLTLAFSVLADPRAHADPATRAQLVAGLAAAAGGQGMVGGQMLDIQAETRPADAAGVRRLQAMKTGALIRFACEAGAMLGSADERGRDAMHVYGGALGAAFQIADDILDVEASAEEMGKATAKDAAAGKATLIAHAGLDGARRELKDKVDQAQSALDAFGPEADILRDAARFAMTRRK